MKNAIMILVNILNLGYQNTNQNINGISTTITTRTNPDGSITTIRETVDRNGNVQRTINNSRSNSSFQGFPGQNVNISVNGSSHNNPFVSPENIFMNNQFMRNNSMTNMMMVNPNNM
jgi:hypothetical protein